MNFGKALKNTLLFAVGIIVFWIAHFFWVFMDNDTRRFYLFLVLIPIGFVFLINIIRAIDTN